MRLAGHSDSQFGCFVSQDGSQMFINKVDNIIPGKLGKTDEFIKPGTTLLTDKPFVFVLKSKLRTEACDNCLERYVKMNF